MSRVPCCPDGNIYSGNSKREGREKQKPVYGSLSGSKLSCFIQRMLLQMIEDDTTKGGGTPILVRAGSHSGRDNGGERGGARDWGRKTFTPRQQLERASRDGRGHSMGRGQDTGPSEECQPGKRSTLARGAFEDKARKRKMRNLTLSSRSLEAAVGWGLGGSQKDRHGSRAMTLYHVSKCI